MINVRKREKCKPPPGGALDITLRQSQHPNSKIARNPSNWLRDRGECLRNRFSWEKFPFPPSRSQVKLGLQGSQSVFHTHA